ncbi:hypothetical protein KQX54_021469 [Cotesia glomerata]|uniref:Uncharacterized protein n=1 Tax=Cotesia glomerata TaxID=32391 RepID=A0AAV7J9C8_COTGL|nr:hypothetical protein KQX54_021469 [Cotesia glomerata]
MVKSVRKEEEQVKYSNQREGCKAAGDLSRIRISRCNGYSNDGGWLVNRRLISTPASVEPGSKKLDCSCLAPVESRSRHFAVISKDLESEEQEETATHSTFIVLVNWYSVIAIVTR